MNINARVYIIVLKDDAGKALHSIYQQIWKTQQWPQDWKRSAFIPISKKGNAKECSNCRTINTHLTRQQSNAQNSPSQASIVYEPWTSRCSSWIYKRQRNQRSNCQHPLDHWKSKRIPEKNINFYFIDYVKAFDCMDHKKLWKILHEVEIPVHLTCLLRNLYASQEATVRTGHGTTNWFKIGKGECQDCVLSPSYLTYMQSILCEMPDWVKHKLESRFLREISIASDVQMTPPLWQ